MKYPKHFLLLVINNSLVVEKTRGGWAKLVFVYMWHHLTDDLFPLGTFFYNMLIFKTSLEQTESIRLSLLNYSHSIKHILSWVFEGVHNKDEFGCLKRQCCLLRIILHSEYTSVGLCFISENPSGCFFLMTLKVTHLVDSSGIKYHKFRFMNLF